MRGIMSTTHTDSHQESMSLEDLKKMEESINSDKKLRWGLDHNRLFPPLGRLKNASITKKDEHYYLEADYQCYEKQKDIEWDNSLVMETFQDPYSFIEVEKEHNSELMISVDPNSFRNITSYQSFWDEVRVQNYPTIATEHRRKASLAIPEIIYTLGPSALIYQILKPVAKRVGDKLGDAVADKIIDQGKIFYNYISKTMLSAFRHGAEANQQMLVIFQLTGIPNVELIAKTKDHDLIMKALKNKKLESLKNEIEFYQSKFNLEKIQFVLNEKGKWKFNYLLTSEGSAIGKKETFRKRDQRYSILLKNSNGEIYNSIGITGR